mmetsp:Transcript_15286/g.40371  ORF Transcript_15286/g.40371 Transcript_15286/m.40371 type:complete len:332 (-) Transcript_15286:1410-2405(-)
MVRGYGRAGALVRCISTERMRPENALDPRGAPRGDRGRPRYSAPSAPLPAGWAGAAAAHGCAGAVADCAPFWLDHLREPRQLEQLACAPWHRGEHQGVRRVRQRGASTWRRRLRVRHDGRRAFCVRRVLGAERRGQRRGERRTWESGRWDVIARAVGGGHLRGRRVRGAPCGDRRVASGVGFGWQQGPIYCASSSALTPPSALVRERRELGGRGIPPRQARCTCARFKSKRLRVLNRGKRALPPAQARRPAPRARPASEHPHPRGLSCSGSDPCPSAQSSLLGSSARTQLPGPARTRQTALWRPAPARQRARGVRIRVHVCLSADQSPRPG